MRSLLIVLLLVTACSEHGQTPPGGGDGGQRDGTTIVHDTRFTCADDSALEPNDSLQTAFQLPAMATITLAGLAICPSTDLDFYRVDITTANKTLDVTASFDPGNASIAFTIDNAAGNAIASSTLTSPTTAHAAVPNLPVATFFVGVVAAGGGENNYTLTVDITP